MIIFDQDRCKAIQFKPEIPLMTTPVLIDEKIYAVNLNYGTHLLATFDDMQSCIDEISAILNCVEPVYFCSGFSDYDGTQDFWDIVKEVSDYEIN